MDHSSERLVADRGLPPDDWLGSSHLPPAATVRRALARTAAAICAMGYLREVLRVGFGIGVHGTSFFNLNGEQNLGAWFSATLLAACAFLLHVAGRAASVERQPWGRFWFVLSVTFVALSIDEASSIHESVMVVLQASWHTTGLFKYAWVIPALVLVPLFGLASIPFLLNLPLRTARWFVVSGAVYVTGALGFEMLGGLTDGTGPVFVLCYLIEETLEIVGALSFFFAIMDHLQGGSQPGA